MYYRTDVFEELGLEIPNTWNDVLELIPTLQRNNMSIGLPYMECLMNFKKPEQPKCL